MLISGDCQFCEGSGRCQECNGTGINIHLNTFERACAQCSGSGICPECNGCGKDPLFRPREGNVLIYGILVALGVGALIVVTTFLWKVSGMIAVIFWSVCSLVFFRLGGQKRSS